MVNGIDQFWEKVQFSDDCWEWTGPRTDRGYGHVWINRKRWMAHRFMWYLVYGIEPTLLICHKCDNPPCVRPRHFFEGTDSDNQKDSVAKGRHMNTLKTHCSKGHPYDRANTKMTRGKRYCRTCARADAHRRDIFIGRSHQKVSAAILAVQCQPNVG